MTSKIKGGPEYLAPEPEDKAPKPASKDQDPKTGPEFGTEGATRADVNPYYEGGATDPVNTNGWSSPLATAGVDHPADKREVPDDE